MSNHTVENHVAPLAEMRRYLSGFEIDETYRSERNSYLAAHLLRLQATLATVPPAKPGDELLELGAAPYLMTLLLKRYTRYDVVAAIRRDDPAPEISITKHNPEYDETHTFLCKNFNVEKDPFPYPDSSFDLVLCCEILEHLLEDPTRMLVEIHRILKPGGRVLITTPNVLVLRNVNALARKKRNIYSPYSGYGPYGRHNREWTLDEVVQLTGGCGYQIESAQLVDTYPHRGYVAWLKKLFPHLRDMVCVLARAEGEPQNYYPDNLYVAMHEKQIITKHQG